MFSAKKVKEKLQEEEKLNEEKDQPEEKSEQLDTSDAAAAEKTRINLEQKIASLEKEVDDYKDRILRKAAEFENYKRRVENDQLNLLKYAAESLIIKILPVIDDFERSFVHIKEAKDVESIQEGIKLVYEKLMKILADQGVKPIEAVGKSFDVHYHEAIMQRKADDVEPNTVIDEFEKGYMYKDRVIRHSKVAVSEDSHEEISDSAEQSKEEKLNNNESENE